MDVFIETGVGGHIDNATQAWTFDLAFWGRCGQGTDEASAVAALKSQLGAQTDSLAIAERLHGDEQAFNRDREPARQDERDQTKAILRHVRPQTIDILESCTSKQLDWVDPERHLPAWATWNTLREMGWHIVDTESRYYLARIGFNVPTSSGDLFEELRYSAQGVERAIDELPPDLIVEAEGEVWTTSKVLRRLAWHERSELVTIRDLAARTPAALEQP